MRKKSAIYFEMCIRDSLYTKQLENSIFLCAMSDNGTLAVVTEDQTSMAKLLVYSCLLYTSRCV